MTLTWDKVPGRNAYRSVCKCYTVYVASQYLGQWALLGEHDEWHGFPNATAAMAVAQRIADVTAD